MKIAYRFGQDWSALLPWRWKEYNWIDFTFWNLRIETSKIAGAIVELEFALFGLHAMVEVYDPAKREQWVLKNVRVLTDDEKQDVEDVLSSTRTGHRRDCR